MLKLTLPRRALRALAHLAARDDIRGYLNGVMIEARRDGRAILVATNGHQLGAIHCAQSVEGLAPDSEPVRIIVPIDIVRAIKRAPKRGELPLEISGEVRASAEDAPPAMMLRDRAHSLALEFMPVEGRFPDYERVIPASAAGTDAGFFNPDYVAAFEACAQDLYPSRMPQSVVHHAGREKPALVTVPSAPEFIGVLMPMRIDTVGATRPTWLTWLDTPAPAMQAAA